MMKRLLLSLLFFLGTTASALAANCTAYPYTLTNGSIADANQVMSNFNNILSCADNNLAHNGANTDISSLSGLTTPLTVTQGGIGAATLAAHGVLLGAGTSPITPTAVMTDGQLLVGQSAADPLPTTISGALTLAASGAATLSGSVRTLHSQVFTSGGTFTVPASATTSTVFRFIVIGAGGGGGGCQAVAGSAAGGGGTGAWGVADLSGFAPSSSVTVTIGAAGAAGGIGLNGGIGGTSSMAYSAVTVISSTGGIGGGAGSASVGFGARGQSGTATIGVGASGLTLISSYSGGASGSVGYFISSSFSVPGEGGGTPFGTSGHASGAGAGGAGTNGGGGGGGGTISGTGYTGGTGGVGMVIVEWVL